MSARHQKYLELKSQLERNAAQFDLEGILHFTKSAPNFYRQRLERDFALENELKEWLSSRASFSEMIDRIAPYNTQRVPMHWPAHVPVRMLGTEGGFGEWENVFLFFPQAFGFLPEKPEEIFGFELVEVSEAIFSNAILPCLSQAFEPVENLAQIACSHRLVRRSVFLYAILHEMAHFLGPWRVSPRIAHELKVNEFQQGALSELSADLLAFKAAGREFPEMVLTTFLTRIFWYLRRDTQRRDVDGWIGSYWWNVARRCKAIVPSHEGRFSVDIRRLTDSLTRELDGLFAFGKRVLTLPAEEQVAHCTHWMNAQAEGNSDGYRVCAELEEIFSRCQSVPTWLRSLETK